METHRELLSTPEDIAKLAQNLKGHDVIAFDTEFIRESTFYPVVEIIQVATDQDSWLVDAQAFKKGYPPGPPASHSGGPQGCFHSGLRPLLDIFEDPAILKIVHAAQGDQECLYTSFGVVASPIIDTAIAASLCGYGDGIGLGKLLKSVLNITIKKGHARTNWSVRPLPEQLIEYAHADVEHLVALGRALLTALDKLGRREWALDLSSKWSDKSVYESDIESMTHKLARGSHLDKRAHAALLELMRWREQRVRQLNLPRRWVADDTVLVDLARVRPKDLAHLGAFRGLNKGELKNSGEIILAALQRASENDTLVVPPHEKAQVPSVEESQVLDLLQCYAGILADEHRIAARHVLTAAQLLPLLRSQAQGPSEWVQAGLLSEYAAKLIGDELMAFIRGRRALSVKDGKVIVVGV